MNGVSGRPLNNIRVPISIGIRIRIRVTERMWYGPLRARAGGGLLKAYGQTLIMIPPSEHDMTRDVHTTRRRISVLRRQRAKARSMDPLRRLPSNYYPRAYHE